MRIIREVSFCKAGSCCPQFRIIRDQNGKSWLEIEDDSGKSIKIEADKELLYETIEKLFEKRR